MRTQIIKTLIEKRTWLTALLCSFLLVGFLGCTRGGIEGTELSDGETIELYFNNVGETTIYDKNQDLTKRWTPQDGEVISFKNIAPKTSNPTVDELMNKIIAYYGSDLERPDTENRNIMIAFNYDPTYDFGDNTFSGLRNNYSRMAQIVNADDNSEAWAMFIKGDFEKARRIGPNGEEGTFYDKDTLEQRIADNKNVNIATEAGATLKFKIVLPEPTDNVIVPQASPQASGHIPPVTSHTDTTVGMMGGGGGGWTCSLSFNDQNSSVISMSNGMGWVSLMVVFIFGGIFIRRKSV